MFFTKIIEMITNRLSDLIPDRLVVIILKTSHFSSHHQADAMTKVLEIKERQIKRNKKGQKKKNEKFRNN
jgi:hypothetical protein